RSALLWMIQLFDAVEQRAEIALAKASIAASFDELDEEGASLGGARDPSRVLQEDLQQMIVRTRAVDEDLVSLQGVEELEPAERLTQALVVVRRGPHEASSATLHLCHRADDVVGQEGDVLDAAAAVAVAEAVDL